MMSDLLASDNINLHNRVGKRDHAHTTLAPPHHESQRTRDQRKGPPPSQRQRHTPTDAKRKGRAEGRRPASRPANRTQSQPHQPTTSSSPRAAGGVYSAPSHGGENGGQSRLAAAGPDSTGRAHMHMLRSGVRDHRNATQGPARDGRRAGWQGKRRRQHARQCSQVIHALTSARRPRGQAPSTAINMQNRCAGAQHTVPGRGARTREGAGWEASSEVSEANCAALSAMPIGKQTNQKAAASDEEPVS